MTLYITDLDGTLLNFQGKLRSRAAAMLNRFINKGVMITYATARRYYTASEIMREVGITLPVIANGGAAIYDGATGKLMKLCSIPEDICLKIKEQIINKGETPLVYSIIDGKERLAFPEWDVSRCGEFLETRNGDPTLRPCKSYDELFKGKIHCLTMVNTIFSKEEQEKYFSKEDGLDAVLYSDVYSKSTCHLEIKSVNATKASAALYIKKLTGAEELVSFGDGLNDLPLFEVSDRKYAVANADEGLKSAADGVIASNESFGVPVFIEQEQTQRLAYIPHETQEQEPYKKRFKMAVLKAESDISSKEKIGTVNEKAIHASLKNYYAEDFSQEAKIGGFYTDAIGENGIYEIQTGNFGKLNKKLDVMLDACHVTVVYPYEKKTRNIYVNHKTGEVLRESTPRTSYSFSQFFLELTRIKAFLTNPNLSICIALLDIQKTIFCTDKRCVKKRGVPAEKKPLELLGEIYLEKPEDYRYFLPKDLPESFTLREFQKVSKRSDGSLLLEILQFMGIVEKVGNKGKAIVYRVCDKPSIFT